MDRFTPWINYLTCQIDIHCVILYGLFITSQQRRSYIFYCLNLFELSWPQGTWTGSCRVTRFHVQDSFWSLCLLLIFIWHLNMKKVRLFMKNKFECRFKTFHNKILPWEMNLLQKSTDSSLWIVITQYRKCTFISFHNEESTKGKRCDIKKKCWIVSWFFTTTFFALKDLWF